MMDKSLFRRQFIKRLTFGFPILLSGTVLAGCRGKSGEEKTEDLPQPSDCSDLTGVSESDKVLRQKFAYTDRSPIPDNQCNNCNLYLPPQPDRKCGSCLLFKGPVNASGYCTYWAPKVDG
jgi:hypothetical protein